MLPISSNPTAWARLLYLGKLILQHLIERPFSISAPLLADLN